MTNILFFGEIMIEFSCSVNKTYIKDFAGDTYNCCWYFNKISKHAFENSLQIQYLTKLGGDRFSQKALQEIASQNIEVKFIQMHENSTMGLYIIQTDELGDRSFDYWRKHSAARQMFSAKKDSLDHKALKQADIIFFSGISIAILNEKNRKYLLSTLKEIKNNPSHTIIIFDGNYRSRLWENHKTAQQWYRAFYEVVDLIMPSVEDEMLRCELTNKSDVIPNLMEEYRGEFIIKNGSEEVFYGNHIANNKLSTPIVTDVVDTTSAGDSFNAQYIFSKYVEKLSTKLAIKKAQILAGKVIGKKGALINEIFEVS